MNTITLNNGVTMPQLGFGVWQVADDEAEEAVATALSAGYRSIDTAKLYRNEAGVGRAVRESGIPRDELFITTKLWNDDHGYDEALRAFDASMERLGLDVLDLYLIHWPAPSQNKYVEAWKALEKLYADGRVRAIGVANFTVQALDRLLDETDVVPVVNQIELHPQLAQDALRAYNSAHGIATEAWSPLGQGKGLLDDPSLARIASKHDRSPAQVVLRWHIQLGNIVIPKSVTPERIRENIDVFDFELDPGDMTAIDAMDVGRRLGPDPATFG
ncbi:aldo/keto reductase [Microtetraspora sp. NBRC 16547]|uniref:aldo/keto reductase n=1 Tax=Microtetraspora sp. NBRC 16547 TaxID=3030993 RepID=UPI0024A34BC7|nr:aldo/keto reductase [Microtetraspora sp. NBRC 16547]GLX01151.1 oxidoreductase [Microtetraspora sp. NBRC 16547]